MKRHLIGIGGVGMSALATALVRLGDEVTGADRTLGTPNIRFLESLGIRCFPDDGSGIDATTDEVIVSTAIEDTNPGLAKAKELGIPVTHRAKALARTLKDYDLVAVVGTCGKSTVTAMLGHVLAECGLDPMCVNGANVPGWEGAVRFGKGRYAVAEVDESDKSLVAFTPYAAVVTNASADHYSKEEMDEVFDAFVKDLPGPLVDGRSDCDATGVSRPLCSDPARGDATFLSRVTEVPSSIPGRHNRQNAAMALRMALALGCDETKAREALLTFQGVERRLQRIVPGVTSRRGADQYAPVVYDDYAHNPEKLRAMWTTVAESVSTPSSSTSTSDLNLKSPQGICVVWRPHGYAPLRKMMDALAQMFAETVRPCDKLLLLPVYDAGGTTDRSINSDALVERLRSKVEVEMVPDLDGAYEWMKAHKNDYAAFVTCGARDPGLPILARRLAAE